MNDPRNDPNYPAQWDVNHQRWFRQQYNYGQPRCSTFEIGADEASYATMGVFRLA
jgi:hypothetical protein